jgi:hypothetical protein
MPASNIIDLIKKRDDAHKAFVESQTARMEAWQNFQTAQDDLAEAILATGTDTFIDEEGNEHRARRGGMATVQSTKANKDA